MSRYTVRWEEDIEADSPLEAAKKARALLNTGAHEFDVHDNRGNVTAFDLEEGTTCVVQCVPVHTHNFVGDEDTCTCVRYKECTITWAEFRAGVR